MSVRVDYARFYDRANPLYWRFWSEQGYIHPGLFDTASRSTMDLSRAIQKTQTWLRRGLALETHERAEDESVRVLELGCGNGSAAIELVQNAGCSVVFEGIDISERALEQARRQCALRLPDADPALCFTHLDMTRLTESFAAKRFHRVYSQAAMCHVRERLRVLDGVAHVLRPGGLFVFDDFTTRIAGRQTQALRFPPLWTLDVYREELEKRGFEVLEARDHREDMLLTYACLLGNIQRIKEQGLDAQALEPVTLKLLDTLEEAYRRALPDIERDLLSWALIRCRAMG